MVDSVEVLRQAEGAIFFDEDGNRRPFKLAPPMTEAELGELSGTLGCALPTELRSVLSYCKGFAGVLDSVDFTGKLLFEASDIFPHGLPVAGDGMGNFWVVDLMGNGSEDTAVFFASHDPPVIAFQAGSLGQFVSELIRFGRDPSDGKISEIHDRYAMEIWRKNPGLLSREESMSGDAELKAFAETLDDSYDIADLRKPTVGQGFSWGRYGHDTVCKRFGMKRIFGIQRKKLSWLQKVFGV